MATGGEKHNKQQSRYIYMWLSKVGGLMLLGKSSVSQQTAVITIKLERLTVNMVS